MIQDRLDHGASEESINPVSHCVTVSFNFLIPPRYHAERYHDDEK